MVRPKAAKRKSATGIKGVKGAKGGGVLLRTLCSSSSSHADAERLRLQLRETEGRLVRSEHARARLEGLIESAADEREQAEVCAVRAEKRAETLQLALKEASRLALDQKAAADERALALLVEPQAVPAPTPEPAARSQLQLPKPHGGGAGGADVVLGLRERLGELLAVWELLPVAAQQAELEGVLHDAPWRRPPPPAKPTGRAPAEKLVGAADAHL